MIREATFDDLARLIPLAQEFADTTGTDLGIDAEHFMDSWKQLLASQMAVIFLHEQDGELRGAIGGVAYPDINSGWLQATEFFWFVPVSCRGGGLKLYQEFEKWARQMGCVQIRMVHLMDVEPLKTAKVYMRLGFRAIEMAYAKELQPWQD